MAEVGMALMRGWEENRTAAYCTLYLQTPKYKVARLSTWSSNATPLRINWLLYLDGKAGLTHEVTLESEPCIFQRESLTKTPEGFVMLRGDYEISDM